MVCRKRFSDKAIVVIGLAFAAFSTCAQARTFKVLHSFTGSDGSVPLGGLVTDTSGNLYGTTSAGGANNDGVVFKLTPRGREIVLHSFTGADGSAPNDGLIKDASDNLYGTTLRGGANDDGVVFKMTPKGREIVLHSFAGSPDGALPISGLITDTDGNFYGTTVTGGAADDSGTVFRVTPRGRLTVLYSFSGKNDGGGPVGGLIKDARGNLYGTASYGSPSNAGVVFELPPKSIDLVLYPFTGGDDGGAPSGGLIMDAGGNLYGTTKQGGRDGDGVVFKLTPRGKQTVLHWFGGADGSAPVASLIMDGDGNLYCTTVTGGAHNDGVVFELTPAGKEIVLHSFTGRADGAEPGGALLRDAAGNLYGTASAGGASGDGVVFEISP